ncbi:alpha-hydroxy-acid oxidizing protein [Alloalcanivorax marinus]|uniref:alpha-hydroxy-acid oxidizing protein n=1 Tax=Alloalcanivorax marinus TaxID=1177169 RepID=UPI0019329A48|nr:alpha-hydroxy-acid oxidizing protein [Alloalcanivorax marinus]MBL7251477.1 alpha-hydroxy-acid oxidizing protein [Alloalcanivorax marinus]
MIISSTHDYRLAAQRRLPPFLFHYIDGGAYDEHTHCAQCCGSARSGVAAACVEGSGEVNLSARLFGEPLGLPVALEPVGLTGM